MHGPVADLRLRLPGCSATSARKAASWLISWSSKWRTSESFCGLAWNPFQASFPSALRDRRSEITSPRALAATPWAHLAPPDTTGAKIVTASAATSLVCMTYPNFFEGACSTLLGARRRCLRGFNHARILDSGRLGRSRARQLRTKFGRRRDRAGLPEWLQQALVTRLSLASVAVQRHTATPGNSTSTTVVHFGLPGQIGNDYTLGSQLCINTHNHVKRTVRARHLRHVDINVAETNATGPDADAIETSAEFGRAMQELRDSSGLSIREVAKQCNRPPATIGDYFSGAHLPNDRKLLTLILTVCGVDQEQIERWQLALIRARRRPRRRAEAPLPGACPVRGDRREVVLRPGGCHRPALVTGHRAV